MICSGYDFTLVSKTFQKLDFLQCWSTKINQLKLYKWFFKQKQIKR